jgi:hypothetical protein
LRLNVSLVPSFRQTISSTQCGARGGSPSTHGAPLALSSCNPPAYLPGTAAHFGGASSPSSEAALQVQWGDTNPANGDQADVGIFAYLYDIRAAGGGPYDPNPQKDVTLVMKVRLTDSDNGSSASDPATVTDLDLRVGIGCFPSLSRPGSDCQAGTSADSITPGMINEQKDTVVQSFVTRVYDSGANGTRGDADDRLFAQQGIYIP